MGKWGQKWDHVRREMMCLKGRVTYRNSGFLALGNWAFHLYVLRSWYAFFAFFLVLPVTRGWSLCFAVITTISLKLAFLPLWKGLSSSEVYLLYLKISSFRLLQDARESGSNGESGHMPISMALENKHSKETVLFMLMTIVRNNFRKELWVLVLVIILHPYSAWSLCIGSKDHWGLQTYWILLLIGIDHLRNIQLFIAL